jgi:choline dehydrogenase-like flavoprotein
MLEAGGDYNTAKQSDMFKWNYDAPHRAAGTKAKPFGYYDATLVGGSGPRRLTSARATISRGIARACWAGTSHYGRISSDGPYDFKPYSRDGKGFDWPISYDDLAPYYDKAEELIGVFGTQEGLENTPDGRFQPAPAPRAHERIIKKVSDRLKIPCIPSRLAILTKPLNGRPACHYCAECGRACAVNANFASPGVHIKPALATGNLELRTGAMCRELMVGPDGRATGVSYIDTKTRREVTVNARVVVLAASCCETARLMLNSKSSLFPNGIANSTGLVGKYIMDTVGSSVGGYLPILEDLPPANDDGVGGMHMYMPWWLYRSRRPVRCLLSRIPRRTRRRAGMPALEFSEVRTTSWAADTARNSSATSARSTAAMCISPAAAR